MGRESLQKFFSVWPAGTVLAGLALAACTPQGAPQASNGAQPASVMNVADAAISGGDPAMALKVSQSVLANDPHNLDALYHEGAAYYAMNRCIDSVAVYKVALTVDPKSGEAEVGIGRCLLKRNAAEAEQAFAAAVQDDPDNASALNDLGIARDLQGNHAGALPPYQQALLLRPGTVSTEVNIGMSLALAGDGDDALQYLGPLATSQEATPKIREDYAAALYAAGRAGEARQVLAIDLPPDGVNQLLSDFALAISPPLPAPAPAATAAPASVPASAPIQTQPLASNTAPAAAAPAATIAAAPVTTAPLAVPAAVAAQEASPPAAPPPAAPPPVVLMPAAPQQASAAMPPASLPSASLAAPPVTAADAGQQAKNAAAYDLLMR